MTIQAMPGKVLVHNMERGERTTSGGIILRNDEGKSEGIHNRWAQVYSVGTDVDDIAPGEWILVEHGRWSREINIQDETLYLVDYPKGVLAAAPEKPNTDSSGVYRNYNSVVPKWF